MRILKFKLNDRTNEISMPKGSQVLQVDDQDGTVMWAACESDNPPETRVFLVVATGETFSTDEGRTLQYQGSSSRMNAHRGLRTVSHVFEVMFPEVDVTALVG